VDLTEDRGQTEVSGQVLPFAIFNKLKTILKLPLLPERWR